MQPAGEIPFTPVAEAVVRGEGPIDLVLVPDFAMDASVWADFMARHEHEARMVAVTLPGFGGSAAPPEPGAMPEFDAEDEPPTPWVDNAVEAITVVIEEKGLDRPVVVGHGFGAMLAFRLALEHPELVGGVVALDGAPATLLYPEPLSRADRTRSVTGSLMAQFTRMSEEQWHERMRTLMTEGVRDEEAAGQLAEVAARTARDVGARYMLEYHLTDLTGRLREIEAPVLVLAAAGDVPVQRVRGEERLHRAWYNYLAGLGDCELDFVPGSRHFVMDDAPEFVDGMLERFLGRVKPGE
ncbi:MAG: alpha/beta hydrolase [Phycisphaerales bacterium]